MEIGVPTGIKPNQNRVGLGLQSVSVLTAPGCLTFPPGRQPTGGGCTIVKIDSFGLAGQPRIKST